MVVLLQLFAIIEIPIKIVFALVTLCTCLLGYIPRNGIAES